jgi:hypothetical protein
MLSMDVDDSRLRSVLAVVRAHWARLAAGEFDPGALSRVKWHMSTSASLRYQTSTELALRTIEALNLGWSLEALGHGGADVASVQISDLAAAFRTCAATTTISLVGDTERIRPAL